MYIMTDSSYQDLLQCHLNESMDYLKTKHSDIRFPILGDINIYIHIIMNVTNVLYAHELKQLINFPTRGDAISDLILTNIGYCYDNPFDASPIGKSDHTYTCIVWKSTGAF